MASLWGALPTPRFRRRLVQPGRQLGGGLRLPLRSQVKRPQGAHQQPDLGGNRCHWNFNGKSDMEKCLHGDPHKSTIVNPH